MKTLVLSFVTLLASVSFAATAPNISIFTAEYAPNATDMSSVTLAKGGKLKAGSTSADLVAMGAGKRTKLLTVYVGQFFSDTKWTNRTEADLLPQVDRSKQVALLLTMKMGLTDAEIKTAFSERLRKNSIDLALTHIADALTKISSVGGVNSGQSIAIVFVKNASGTETMYVQKEGKAELTVDGPAGFARQIFSIWLGSTADDGGLNSMKQSVIAGQ